MLVLVCQLHSKKCYSMKKTLIYIISVIGLFSCDLDEVPVSEVSKEPVFSTENGLELYANSFYGI